jgi:hypothetical protein
VTAISRITAMADDLVLREAPATRDAQDLPQLLLWNAFQQRPPHDATLCSNARSA